MPNELLSKRTGKPLPANLLRDRVRHCRLALVTCTLFLCFTIVGDGEIKGGLSQHVAVAIEAYRRYHSVVAASTVTVS